MRCVVFTPASAPLAKRTAIEQHGAILHAECDDYDTAEREARRFAAAEGRIYISPYNHRDVIAGAGTLALDKGPVALTIEAVTKSGQEILELKHVQLTRVK